MQILRTCSQKWFCSEIPLISALWMLLISVKKKKDQISTEIENREYSSIWKE